MLLRGYKTYSSKENTLFFVDVSERAVQFLRHEPEIKEDIT